MTFDEGEVFEHFGSLGGYVQISNEFCKTWTPWLNYQSALEAQGKPNQLQEVGESLARVFMCSVAAIEQMKAKPPLNVVTNMDGTPYEPDVPEDLIIPEPE